MINYSHECNIEVQRILGCCHGKVRLYLKIEILIFKLQDDKISDYDKVPENIFLSFLEKLLGTVHL